MLLNGYILTTELNKNTIELLAIAIYEDILNTVATDSTSKTNIQNRKVIRIGTVPLSGRYRREVAANIRRSVLDTIITLVGNDVDDVKDKLTVSQCDNLLYSINHPTHSGTAAPPHYWFNISIESDGLFGNVLVYNLKLSTAMHLDLGTLAYTTSEVID